MDHAIKEKGWDEPYIKQRSSFFTIEFAKNLEDKS